MIIIVPITDTTIDPMQPRRLEKNANIQGYSACPAEAGSVLILVRPVIPQSAVLGAAAHEKDDQQNRNWNA